MPICFQYFYSPTSALNVEAGSLAPFTKLPSKTLFSSYFFYGVFRVTALVSAKTFQINDYSFLVC